MARQFMIKSAALTVSRSRPRYQSSSVSQLDGSHLSLARSQRRLHGIVHARCFIAISHLPNACNAFHENLKVLRDAKASCSHASEI